MTPRVTIRGVTGITPTSGVWTTTQQGDTVVMEASGPAKAVAHMAGGSTVEIEVPENRTVSITLTGVDAVVTFG